MQVIHPISKEMCNPYIGKPVCAVLHDGSRVFGYLQGIEGERLVLRDQPVSAVTSSKKKRKKVQSSAYAPYPPFGFFPGGLLTLELALIALLFAVPFFW